MSRELITTWSGYQQAIDRLLPLASRQILIYDEDLVRLSLGSSRLQNIKQLLKAGKADAMRIALRNSSPLQTRQPQLLGLLGTWAHLAAAQQTPEHLSHLRDAMLLVDGTHGLIRFDTDQARSVLLIDEPEALQPYMRRFETIWGEGGTPIHSAPLGL